MYSSFHNSHRLPPCTENVFPVFSWNMSCMCRGKSLRCCLMIAVNLKTVSRPFNSRALWHSLKSVSCRYLPAQAIASDTSVSNVEESSPCVFANFNDALRCCPKRSKIHQEFTNCYEYFVMSCKLSFSSLAIVIFDWHYLINI